MKEYINKAIPALITTLIITTVTTWFTYAKQLEENKGSILKIAEDLEKIERSHTRRLENLEHSRETMQDYYVTRREFNLVIQTLDERMQKVDRNVEKLLDFQIKKN